MCATQTYVVVCWDTKENKSRECPRAEIPVLSDWKQPAVWLIEYPHSRSIIENFTTLKIEKFLKAGRKKEKSPLQNSKN